MRKVYAKVLWDGVHGEPVEVEVTNKTYRMIRKEQRLRERFPHLYRQFWPRRLAKGRRTRVRRERYWHAREIQHALNAVVAVGGVTVTNLRGDLQT